MHALIGLGIVASLIAFVFGANAARVFVGAVLLLAAAAFAYVMFRIVSGTI